MVYDEANDDAVCEAQMTSHSFMTVVAAAGLAVLLASPANAAERKKERQYVSPNTGWWNTTSRNGKPSNTVTFSTYVLGTDPDPRIRHGIMQDIGSKFGGGPD
jgi:hypothetical protein